eukprot:evm.model.scf_371.4 EVM.evm.TU.scf_371.4   scf_371:48862-56343(+)
MVEPEGGTDFRVGFKTAFDVMRDSVLRGEKAECPNAFPEAPCYFLGSESKYYTADRGKKASFDDAERECLVNGGKLVEINSPEEHWLLSGLATREGSWLGLRLNKSSDPFIWRWLQSGEALDGPSGIEGDGGPSGVGGGILWARRSEDKEDCAAIDRRAVRNNVADVDCLRVMAFICEYDEENIPKECEGPDLVRVGKRGVAPVTPRIEDCTDFETALVASTKLVKSTADIDSATAICPLGEEERSTEEVRCCCSDVGCVEEKNGMACIENAPPAPGGR